MKPQAALFALAALSNLFSSANARSVPHYATGRERISAKYRPFRPRKRKRHQHQQPEGYYSQKRPARFLNSCPERTAALTA